MITVTRYIATDGTLFETAEECTAYENRFNGMPAMVTLYDENFEVISDQEGRCADANYMVLTDASAYPWLQYIYSNSGTVDPPQTAGTYMVEDNAFVDVDERISYYQNIKNSIVNA